MARALTAAGFKPARTIVFCAWAGEELGLQGSRYYTEHPVIPLDKTALYMNMDMVGTGDSDLLVGGMTEFAELFEIVKRGLDTDTIAKLKPRPNYRGSDHTSFWTKNVPAISLRTGRGPDGEARRRASRISLARATGRDDRPASSCAWPASITADILQYLASTRENLLDPLFGRSSSTATRRSSTCTATRSPGPWPART